MGPHFRQLRSRAPPTDPTLRAILESAPSQCTACIETSQRPETGTGSGKGIDLWPKTHIALSKKPATPAKRLQPQPRALRSRPQSRNGTCWRKSGTALIAYLLDSEVHTFAFSVAANAIISFIPFAVLLYTLALSVFHSEAMRGVVDQMVNYYLPSAAKQQDWLANTIFSEAVLPLLHRKSAQALSLVMILIACTGIFLPLEVALNQAWGVAKSRNYLFNQTIAFGLAILMAALALLSMIVTVWVKNALGVRHFPQHQWLHFMDFRWNHFSLSDGLERRGGDSVFFLGLLRASQPQGALAAGFAHIDYHGHRSGCSRGSSLPWQFLISI